MLTAQGMRQRYLLGQANMKRYSQTYSFLDIDNPEEILILSTDYMRTIQSGYSEMMGMFPPNTQLSQNLTSTQL